MSSVNFDNLLNVQMDQIERPKPLPQGRYRSIVKEFKYITSDQKKTPGAEVTFKILGPIETEDDAAASAYDYSDREMKTTYWLTKDSLFRIKEFLLEHCHIHDSGRPLGDVMNDCPNQEVGVNVVHTPNKKNPTEPPYANVGSTFAL